MRQSSLLKMFESIGLYLRTLLFDLSFQHYISLQIIPLCYLLVLISSAGGLAFLVVTSFIKNAWLGLFYLCLSPMVFLIWVSICRVVLELLIVVFRITAQLDHVSSMNDSLGEVTALTRPLSRLFQSKPARPPRPSSRSDTPPPTNHRR
jgi:pilus assembly protein TadC